MVTIQLPAPQFGVHDEWTRNGGDCPEGSETVTIVFDAEHKVSIQLGISAGVLETN